MRKRRVAAAKSPHVNKNERVILWLKPLPGAILFYVFPPLSRLKLPVPISGEPLFVHCKFTEKSLSFQGEVGDVVARRGLKSVSKADTIIPHSSF